MSTPKNMDKAELFEEIKKFSEDAAEILHKKYPNVDDLLRLTEKDLKKHLSDKLQRSNRHKILDLINQCKKKHMDTAELFEEIKKVSLDAAKILRMENRVEGHLLSLTKEDLKKLLPDIGEIRESILCLINQYKQAETSEASVSGQRGIYKFRKSPFTSVKVKVLVAGETFRTEDTFMKKLKLKKVDPQKSSKIIILFCPVVSRIGTDMEAAMARVTEDKPVILVFMHHCHNPSHMINVTVQPTGDKIVKTVHCAFLETKGLLHCKENNQAIEAVLSELNKYKKEN